MSNAPISFLGFNCFSTKPALMKRQVWRAWDCEPLASKDGDYLGCMMDLIERSCVDTDSVGSTASQGKSLPLPTSGR
jgi:hypothetical protein